MPGAENALAKRKRRSVTGPPLTPRKSTALQQPEIDFDLGFHRDRLAILHAGLKLPPLHGIHGFFIQTQAQAVQYAHVNRLAFGVHLHVQQHRALILCLAGFFGILRLYLIDQRRGRDAAAHAENASAEAAAFTRTETATLTGTHTAARTATDTAARPGAVRRRPDL